MLASTAPSFANQIFDFSFSSGNLDATGELITSDLSGNAYNIVGITGFINGAAITGIEPAGSSITPAFPADNTLFATGALVDSGGFIIQSDGFLVNSVVQTQAQIQQSPLEASSLPGVFVYDDHIQSSYTVGSFSVSPAPVSLPASAWLFCSALISWLGWLKRKGVNSRII
jgi:hypothetical protein